MRALIIGDQHFADNPPSSRTETYRDDLLDKARWIINYANEQEVDVVLNLGDVFHIKQPNRNSHYLVREAAEIYGSSNAPMLICPGNHDLTTDDLDTLNRQPLGVLGLHPKITVLQGASKEFPVFSIPYVDPTEENISLWVEKYHAAGGPKSYPMVITHQAIFPEAEEPIYDYVSAENLADALKAKYLAYGHIHTRMKAGAFFEIGGTWFCNNGAISRGSLHEETINRKLAVTLFDDSVEGNPYTSIPIPYKPPEEVFRLDAVEILNQRKDMVGNFLDSLGSSELQYLTVESIIDEAKKNRDFNKKTLQELEDIIIKVTTE